MTSLDKIADTVQKVTIVLGVFVGIFAFCQTQLEKRIGRSFEFAKKPEGEQSKRLGEFVKKWNEYVAKNNNQLQGTFKDREEAMAKFFETEEIRDMVDQISDTYDTIYICVRENLCDQDTILALIQHDTKMFYNICIEYIPYRRDKMKSDSFGLGASALSKMHKENFFRRVNPFG